MALDLSEPLTDSEKLARLQEQIRELQNENRTLRSENRTLVNAAPSKHKSVNTAELNTLQSSKAELKSELSKLEAAFRQSGGRDDHNLLQQSKVRKQLNEVNQKIALREPKNEYVPECRSRSRKDQLVVDELTYKLSQAKQALEQSPSSNLALLSFNKASSELKKFVKSLEDAHHKRILDSEKQRQSDLEASLSDDE